MICEECRTSGRTSRVSGGQYGTRTLMMCHPYWDEVGVYHSHDMNAFSTGYTCSNGHKWSTSTFDRCPAENCPWNDQAGVYKKSA